MIIKKIINKKNYKYIILFSQLYSFLKHFMYLLILRFHLQDFNQVFPLIVKLLTELLVKLLQLKNRDLFTIFLLELSYMGQRMNPRRPLNYIIFILIYHHR